MPGLLEQIRYVDPKGCCISFFFFLSNTRCFLLIPFSLIFGVQILLVLCYTPLHKGFQGTDDALRANHYKA